MVNIGNDWDEVLKGEFKKEYYQKMRKFLINEIQFRTIAMDFWASLEHKIRYNKQMTENIEEINRELLECARMCNELDDRMQRVKNKSNIEDL